jgi:hypothetical protein
MKKLDQIIDTTNTVNGSTHDAEITPVSFTALPIPHSVLTQACLHCGTEFTVPAVKKKGRKKKYCSHSCAVKYYGKTIRSNEERTVWVANYYQQYPAKRFAAAVKQSAKQRGLSFDLPESWFKERLDRGGCEISGLPIRIKLYKQKDIGKRNFYSPSVDRIDNNIGYIPSNCRLVCWGYNIGKYSYTDRDLSALSVVLIMQSLSASVQPAFLELMLPTLLANLPSGHQLF